MEMLLGFIYLIVTGTVLVSMATLFLRGNRNKANLLYLIFQGLVAIWCSSQIMVLLSTAKWELSFAYLFGNIGICFIGMFWYYFAVVYTGGELKGVRRVVPLFCSFCHYVLVCTNGWHHLYYAQFDMNVILHGPFFYTNVVMTYFFIVVGAILIYKDILRVQEDEKEKENGHAPGRIARVLVVISVLIPVLMNAFYLTGLVKASYDITPLGFAASVILTMLATVKYQFIDLKRELAITNEKLLLEKERNRIAQQVHDTAGHTLTMIQSYMKLAQLAVEQSNEKDAKEYLEGARSLTSQGIRELRESINQLREEAEYELVTQGVMQLAGQVKEIPVEVTVQGQDSSKYSHLSKVIYDTVRESITNSLKYAQASKIEIIIRFQPERLQLTIGDDGKGCQEIKDNNGLRGIRERIEKVDGTVRFMSTEGEGFLTMVKIPV